MAQNQNNGPGDPGQGTATNIRFGVWNRLEARPRKVDFSETLSNPTADALWMLTRQWQFGEFTGEDAATSIMAKVIAGFTPVSRFGWENHVDVFDTGIPIEAQVEGEKVPFDWRTHLQVTAYWKKILKTIGASPGLFQEFVDLFPITKNDSLSTTTWELEDIIGDTNLSNHFLFFNNKTFNSTIFIEKLNLYGGNASDLLRNMVPANKLVTILSELNTLETQLNDASTQLLNWMAQLYIQPHETTPSISNPTPSRWDHSRLEYRFDLAVPEQTANSLRIAIRSKEYYQGQPDWYAFEIDKTLPSTSPLIQKDQLVGESIDTETKTITLLSSKCEFPSMPAARWWEFENNAINYGRIDANTTDLTTIIIAEFGLVASTDWQSIPFNVKVGSLSTINSIVVTDSFGFNTQISPVDPNDPWNFISLTRNTGGVDSRLFFPPVTFKTHEGNPLEHILFMRDEMANMVWAVEKTVPGFLGTGIDAYQAYLRRKAILMKNSTAPVQSIKSNATYSYKFASDVPENWIPFVPSKVSTNDPSIQLLRGKTVRKLGSKDVKPRGKILTEKPFPYFIFEEEVPREGIQVIRSFQRARWFDGKVICWLGRKKVTGKGEGSSGLVFDQLIRNE